MDFRKISPHVSIWLGLSVLVLVIGVAIYHWSAFGEWYDALNHEKLRNVVLIIAALLGTPLVVWRTWLVAENTKIANRNAEIAEKNTKIAQQNSLTDTFTKAIEQLGATSQDQPNIEVRLGAIYSLEKLAQVNEEYYQAIIDILCSYIRQNSPNLEFPSSEEKTEVNKKVRIDIQTAMTVIGRRAVRLDEPPLGLNDINLHGAKLEGAKLEGADLGYTDLRGADLRGANLDGAIFIGASIRCANIEGANIEGAELIEANLEDADLGGANLYSADLRGAYLKGADLYGADLYGADLSGANLLGARNLSCEQLKRAKRWQHAYRDSDLACGAPIPRPPSEEDL